MFRRTRSHFFHVLKQQKKISSKLGHPWSKSVRPCLNTVCSASLRHSHMAVQSCNHLIYQTGFFCLGSTFSQFIRICSSLSGLFCMWLNPRAWKSSSMTSLTPWQLPLWSNWTKPLIPVILDCSSYLTFLKPPRQ